MICFIRECFPFKPVLPYPCFSNVVTIAMLRNGGHACALIEKSWKTILYVKKQEHSPWIVKDRIALNCLAEFEILIPTARILQIFCRFSVDSLSVSVALDVSLAVHSSSSTKTGNVWIFSATMAALSHFTATINPLVLWTVAFVIFCEKKKTKKKWNPPYPVNRSACIKKGWRPQRFFVTSFFSLTKASFRIQLTSRNGEKSFRYET